MIRALMASPKATNLFKRAIIESDPQMFPLEQRTVSRDIVGSFALSQLNCTDVACARGKNLSDILAASASTQTTTPNMDPRVPVTPWSPTIDGTWVKGDWSALIATNSLPNAVDTLIGNISPCTKVTFRHSNTRSCATSVLSISNPPPSSLVPVHPLRLHRRLPRSNNRHCSPIRPRPHRPRHSPQHTHPRRYPLRVDLSKSMQRSHLFHHQRQRLFV